jgi:hypothetical protein
MPEIFRKSITNSGKLMKYLTKREVPFNNNKPIDKNRKCERF